MIIMSLNNENSYGLIRKITMASFIKKIINIQKRFNMQRIIRAIMNTFASIFPFILIGTFADAIEKACFSPNGFFTSIYHLNHIIPTPIFNGVHAILQIITDITINISSVFAAFFIAKYIAKSYCKNEQMAGITGVIFFLMTTYNFNPKSRNVFFFNDLGMNNLLLAIIFGMFAGWLFTKLSQHHVMVKQQKPTAEIMRQKLNDFIPIIVTLSIGALISYLIYLVAPLGITKELYLFLAIPRQSHHQLFNIIRMIFFNNLMCCVGLYGPLNVLHQTTDLNQTTANLNYAIIHHSLANVPYPISMHALYYTYATFGGNGMVNGLIIAILLCSHNHYQRKIAKLSLVPNLLNFNSPLLVGLPIILNPLLIIPFLITPVISVLIAYFFIKTGLVPPTVYPIPPTTPGILAAYLGTNCNIGALLVSILNLVIATLIYMPFVKMSDKLLNAINKEEGFIDETKK